MPQQAPLERKFASLATAIKAEAMLSVYHLDIARALAGLPVDVERAKNGSRPANLSAKAKAEQVYAFIKQILPEAELSFSRTAPYQATLRPRSRFAGPDFAVRSAKPVDWVIFQAEHKTCDKAALLLAAIEGWQFWKEDKVAQLVAAISSETVLLASHVEAARALAGHIVGTPIEKRSHAKSLKMVVADPQEVTEFIRTVLPDAEMSVTVDAPFYATLRHKDRFTEKEPRPDGFDQNDWHDFSGHHRTSEDAALLLAALAGHDFWAVA